MSRATPLVSTESRDAPADRFELRHYRPHRVEPVVSPLLDRQELLEWVLALVGPQALRDFALAQVPGDQLTTQQAAERLGMSRPTLIKLVDRGVLPHMMVGNRRYLPVAAVEAYRRERFASQESHEVPVPDPVVDANLRLLQHLAEEEGDFS